MNPYKNENSLKNLSNKEKLNSKNYKIFNVILFNKVLDSINISLLILIFILSFISLDSQKRWTNIYANLSKTRTRNSNLIDYISKTEEFYINEIESLNNFKKTTPKDLLHLDMKISKKKKNFFREKIKFIYKGIKDSSFHRGY